ncbi:hypothetical protein MRB53_040620 [Persea americana]|nr:hypothetical protein MRB53_040620 [Persea americana]
MTAGGSVLQSPLIMPMLRLPTTPATFASQETAYLLHNSEYFFPSLNMACTLSNLLLTYVSWSNSSVSEVSAKKLPLLGLAAVCNVLTTAYALGIMVPMNKRMTALSKEMGGLGEKAKGGVAEREFRGLQARWAKLNYGRASLMVGAAVAGMTAIMP